MSHYRIFYCGQADCDNAFCSHNSWVREAPLFYGSNDNECPLNYLVRLLRYAKHFHATQEEFFTLILWFSSRGEFHDWIESITCGFSSSTDFAVQFMRKYGFKLCKECIWDRESKFDYLQDLTFRYFSISQEVEHDGIFWKNDEFETEPPQTGYGSEYESGNISAPTPDTVEVSNAECISVNNDFEIFNFAWLYEIPEQHESFVVSYAFIHDVDVSSVFTVIKAKSNKVGHKAKNYLSGRKGKLGNHLERQKVKMFSLWSFTFAFEFTQFLQKSLFDFRLLHMPFESG